MTDCTNIIVIRADPKGEKTEGESCEHFLVSSGFFSPPPPFTFGISKFKVLPKLKKSQLALTLVTLVIIKN